MTETFDISIENIAHGGFGVGFHAGKTVFVPFTIPGEQVTARVHSATDRVIHARGVKLLEASGDRVFPVCAHFGACGRCHWQHMDYAAQLALKQDLLADQLARFGGLDDNTITRALRPTLPSPEQWGYLHHLTFDVTPDGVLGLPHLDGDRTLPISECHILHPELLDLYHQLDLELTGITRVKLMQGSDGGQMLILTLAGEEAPELETDLNLSVNAILPDNTPMNLIGDSHARYTIRDHSFRATAGAYFRANIGALPTLIDTVLELLDLRGGETVLDAYSGVGVLGAFAAEHAGLVTLIDSYPPAVTDADENLAAFENVDVIEGGLESVLPELDERYDAAILDPGGRGLGKGVIAQIAARRVPKLIYVNDDPTALARDLKPLAQSGYHLQTVQPIDLNPQTYYVETVSVFTLR